MADLKFVVDLSDLVELSNLLKKDLPSDTQKFARDAVNSFLRVNSATQKARKEAKAYAGLVKALEQDVKMLGDAHQHHYNTLLKVNKETKSARDSAAVFAKAIRDEEEATAGAARASARHEAQLDKLRSKYNPLYAASKLYERSLAEINEALEVGAIGLKQHEVALESLNREYQAFGNGSATVGNRFVQATQQNTRSMGQWSTVTQQAGYQIGDFLVQVQSGTNWMVAFGQQATQVAGTLTLFGGKMVLIGTALGIAIPLITAVAAAIMRTREANKEAADSVKTLDDELKSLNTTLKDWVNTKKASQLGLTVEELLGIKGIEQAQDKLKDARQ